MEGRDMRRELQGRIDTTRKALQGRLEELCVLLDKRPQLLLKESRLPELETQLGDGTRLVRELQTLHRVARGEATP